jgi:hypothetical protein
MIGEFCPKVFALNVIRGARGDSSYRGCCRRLGTDRQRLSTSSFIHSKKLVDGPFHEIRACALVSVT